MHFIALILQFCENLYCHEVHVSHTHGNDIGNNVPHVASLSIFYTPSTTSSLSPQVKLSNVRPWSANNSMCSKSISIHLQKSKIDSVGNFFPDSTVIFMFIDLITGGFTSEDCVSLTYFFRHHRSLRLYFNVFTD